MAKPLTPKQIAEKIGPRDFMRLCEKVTSKAGQKFDVYSIEKSGQTCTIQVELEDGTTKTVTI